MRTTPTTNELPANAAPTTPDEDSLVQSLKLWERKLKTLQRRYPRRWCVRGWSDEEVRDALTLHLFEAMHQAAHAQRDAADWALDCLAQRVRQLQRGSRLNVTVMDLSDAPLMQTERSHEQLYLEREDDARRAMAAGRARAHLSQPQRRWLAAMQWTANQGEFFESSDRPNLSAAARAIGKNRSSAVRAYQELQSRFQDELDRLE